MALRRRDGNFLKGHGPDRRSERDGQDRRRAEREKQLAAVKIKKEDLDLMVGRLMINLLMIKVSCGCAPVIRIGF